MIGADDAGRIAALRAYPFIEPLPDGLVKKLLPHISERTYRAGEVILRAGEYSDAAFYLTRGTVKLVFAAAGPPTPAAPRRRGIAEVAEHARMDPTQAGGVGVDGTVLVRDMPIDATVDGSTTLAAGELFGEINALARYAISTDVVAKTDVDCLVIRAPALQLLFKQKAIAWFKEQVDAKYRERTLGQHLKQVNLFAELSSDARDRLRREAELVTFDPGAVIVEQDGAADAFFLVRGGQVKVAARVGTRDLAVTYLRKGDYAGEIALLVDNVWPYTLEALEYVQLVKIPRELFQRLIAEEPAVERHLWDAAVQRLKQRGAAIRNPSASQYLQLAMDTGLIHGESVLLIDVNTCTRCDDCVRACADTHGGTPRFVREDRLLRDGGRYRHWMVPHACYQCSDPSCLVGCPTGAITRALGTLEVTINPATCIGCGNCVRRCPWDNIMTVPFGDQRRPEVVGDLATKCDLCLGRASGPACVQMCPHGSAVRVSFKDLAAISGTLSD